MCCLPVIQCVHNLCFDPLFIIQAALDESYEILCADVAMLNSRESSQPPNSKEFWRRILHAHANRIPGCQVYPVERSLHIRQAFVELPDNVRIRRNSKTYAVHNARKSDI